jgi:hypothetical protein
LVEVNLSSLFVYSYEDLMSLSFSFCGYGYTIK